jgi:DNA invertase Pin-like site-specific DNA recombinase
MISQTNVRCAIYTRVNVTNRAGASCAAQVQRDAAQAFIQRHTQHGWSCVETYEDVDQSGVTLERPALQRLFADMSADKLDCVVVLSWDRLTRSIDDIGELIQKFCKHDVTLYTVSPFKLVVLGGKVGNALDATP